MKICFATYEGVPLARGGPYIKIIEVKKQLEKLGHEVKLFNMWETNVVSEQFEIIHLVGANLSIYGLARNLRSLQKNYLVEPVFFSNRSPGLIKLLSSTDKLVRKFISGVWFDHGILRDICSWSDMILPNTSAEKELLVKSFNLPEEKFAVIPNGVSEKFLHGDSTLFEKKYGVKDFILTVGHIGPKRKNILSLVKALNKIDCPAVIIGKRLNTGETKLVLSEAEKNKNLILIDELPNESELLASAYAACKVFVLPSLFETPGIAALEAAIAGANIVITPFGGTKDYFKDIAEYVNPFSHESIQKGLEKSLNTKKSDLLSKHISNSYTWNKIAEKSIDIYSTYLIRKS